MGICGTAMGNAALLARAAGHEVLGADSGVYPPMSTVLAQAGIALHEGYDAARLARLAPDLVVIGNAMSRGNPEVEWLLDTRVLPFSSLPALLQVARNPSHPYAPHARENLDLLLGQDFGTDWPRWETAIRVKLAKEPKR